MAAAGGGGREGEWQRPGHQLAPLPSDLYLLPSPLPPEGRAPCPASLKPRVLVPVLWASTWTLIVTHNSSHSLQSGLPPCLPPHPCTRLPHSPFSSRHLSNPSLLVAPWPSFLTKTLVYTPAEAAWPDGPPGRGTCCVQQHPLPSRKGSLSNTPTCSAGPSKHTLDLDSLKPRQDSAYPKPPESVAKAGQSSAH